MAAFKDLIEQAVKQLTETVAPGRPQWLPFRKGGLVAMADGGRVPTGDIGVAEEAHPVGDFLGFTSPATALPGLAQIGEWAYQLAGKTVPKLISKGANLPFALYSGLAAYSPDTANDWEERAYMKAAQEGIDADWTDAQVYNRYREALQAYKDEQNADRDRKQAAKVKRLKENTPYMHFADGGMVNSNGPFNPKSGFLKGGLNLINPQNTVSGPLDIQYNTNNMLAKQRAHYG